VKAIRLLKDPVLITVNLKIKINFQFLEKLSHVNSISSNIALNRSNSMNFNLNNLNPFYILIIVT